ncbi:MAG TPA: glycosyltransferase family 4 protein [Thermoplasmata archaeon]|nr:glycosyltransferase family 4 protein [Thermoplasmata archaeon]
MRVAILHDHMSFIGGGERVVLTLARGLGADLYVTDLDPEIPRRAGFADVRVTELAKVPKTPLIRQTRQAKAFHHAEIPDHDAYVFSGNWAIAAAETHTPNLWYCHTPARVFYDLEKTFLADLGPAKRVAARTWIRRTRPKYEADVAAVQRIVVNSRNVADRVKRYLHRTADVVYPPVDVSRHRYSRVGDFWLSVNRLSHEKRIGLQVEAFRRLPGERLVVAGGPQVGVDSRTFLRSLNPPPNVKFLGEVDDAQLRELYATCRGLVATSQDEDFGLTPVEAMASGKAVVAVDEGGYRETVIPGRTGWLVPATAESIVAAIQEGTPDRVAGMRPACEERAKAFDAQRFVERMRDLVGRLDAGAEAAPAKY